MPHYKTIFLSDIHLRTRWCKSDLLYKFLCEYTCDQLFLVGDIVDTWNADMAFIDVGQCRVVEKIVDHPCVDMLIGNHDVHHLQLAKYILPNIRMFDELYYTTDKGQRLLVTHGHQYDSYKFFDKISSFRYLYNIAAKRGNTKIVKFFSRVAYYFLEQDLSQFKSRAYKDVHEKRLNGIICGHVHFPEISYGKHGFYDYYNTGDWVSHSTALVENPNGDLQLVNYDG